MRKVNRILALLFVFALVLSMTVFAADEGTFNASVELNYTDQQIEVIVPDENDTVLKEQKPTLTIKCAFEKAYVKLGDEVVDAAPVLADGYITFRVAAAGTYLIVEGEAPVVVTPTPTPTPEVTPVPSPTVTPTPTPVPSPSPTPTPTPGEVKDVSPDTNTGGAKLTNSEKELKDAIPLTEDEKQAMENGEDLVVWLNVEDGADKVSATDRSLIGKKQGSYKIGMYLNIDMYKQIGNRAPERLNKLNDDVTISLTLPERLINKNSNLFRNYRIICVQDDVASVIKPTFNADTKTLSFETNHFSTYAIAYKDTNVPQTGDNSHVVLWGTATLLSAAALITTIARLRKKAEEN